MIKAKKGNTLILGLSDENLRRLKAGEPISFNLKDVDMGDVPVVIFHGKDEQEMFKTLKSSMHPTKTEFRSSRAKDN